MPGLPHTGGSQRNNDQALGRFDLELRSRSRFALICAIDRRTIASLAPARGRDACSFVLGGFSYSESRVLK